MKRPTGFVVAPLSTEAIYGEATTIREALQRVLGAEDYIRLDHVYEILPKLLTGFQLQVCDERELGPDHGQTFPDDRLIKLREDVYDGMCRGVGRDRFTGAHELGHLFLHQGAARFARRRTEDIPVYRDSEWQADEFGSALLINRRGLSRCKSVPQVMERFGVSEPAAQVRLRRGK